MSIEQLTKKKEECMNSGLWEKGFVFLSSGRPSLFSSFPSLFLFIPFKYFNNYFSKNKEIAD
jgi:hypothetical protein